MMRLFLAAAIAVSLTGCGAFAERQAISQTEFSLANVALERADMPIGENPGAHMRLALDVKNPNAITARLDKFDYEIFMNGAHVGTGSSTQEFAVEPGQTGRLELPVFVPYKSLPDATKVLQDRKSTMTVKGVSHLETVVGALNFPVEVSRDISF